MQSNAIAGSELPQRGVRGLGVSDVLELDLDPIQLPWLIDELDATRQRLEEHREAAAGVSTALADPELVDEKEYALRLLGMMRTRLPRCAHQGPVVLVGPSGMVEDAVHGAVRRVISALNELARQPLRGDTNVGVRLHETGAAAAAWVETLVACQGVVAFNFDPEANPGAAW